MNNNMNMRGFALRLVDNLYRHKVLYLLPAILLGSIGLYLASGVSEYESKGVVFVESETFLSSLTDVRSEGFSFRSPSDVANEQLRGLLATDAFIASVVERSGVDERLRGPGQNDGSVLASARRSISAQPGGENFLTIKAEASQPDVAHNLAIATIETYVQWQIDSDLRESLLAEQFVDDLVVGYEVEVAAARQGLTDWMSSNPGSNVIDERPIDEQLTLRSLQDEIAAAEERYNSAISKGEEARLATAQAEADVRQSFAVVDEPQLPTSTSNGLIDVVLRGVTFGFVGLMMAGAVLAFMSASDTTLRFPSEIEELLGVDLLAVVPKVSTQ